MLVSDNIGIHGEYKIEGFDLDGKKVFEDVVTNVVVQNTFTAFFKLLKGEAIEFAISHIAVGTGATAAAKSDTALVAEVARKAVTTVTYNSNKVTVKLSVAPSEFVASIKELGVFVEATDTLGSGVMLSRCNYVKDKNASTQLLITYTLTAE